VMWSSESFPRATTNIKKHETPSTQQHHDLII
jgi:hypothetical protein